MPEWRMVPEDVAAYFQRRLGAPGLRVTGLTRFPRGVSRETWFVDAEDGAAAAPAKQTYVIRRDLAGRSICTAPLRFEYELFHRLHGTAVPVARALWYEDDPEWSLDGRDLYVREFVDGTWNVPHFTDPDPQYDDLRVAACKEHARKLAAIHLLDWRTLGFGELTDVPPDASACALTAIDRLERKLAEVQIEPLPVVAEALGWLRDHAPRSAPRVSLLKGNNGLGEEIWEDGRIVAMSDWELASIGDPAYDFAWCQAFSAVDIKGKWNLQSFLDYYEEVSGIHVEPASIAYYKLIQALEGAVFTHNAAIPVVNNENLLARLCWVSTEVQHTMTSGLARGVGIL
ncbi:MAG: phosphotransferase family protein [Dehalococcoidia bacterium]|nr:phosphotransferase family protein [Dehalococcoidia bacterium]